MWDLRGKREVVALAYGGGAGTLAGQSAGSGLAVGGRRGMSDIAWHPDNVRLSDLSFYTAHRLSRLRDLLQPQKMTPHLSSWSGISETLEHPRRFAAHSKPFGEILTILLDFDRARERCLISLMV